jgi:hypothetical protein
MVVEPSGLLREISLKLNLKEIGCEDGSWMELVVGRVQ